MCGQEWSGGQVWSGVGKSAATNAAATLRILKKAVVNGVGAAFSTRNPHLASRAWERSGWVR